MEKRLAVGPCGLWILKEWNETPSVEVQVWRNGSTCDLCQRWKKVVVTRKSIDVDAGFDFAWQSQEERYARSTFMRRSFRPLHPSVEHLRALGTAVICHENQKCISGQVPFVQLIHQQPHVLVDVDDHAQKRIGRLVALVLEQICIALLNIVGTVRSIRTDIGEERLLLF